MRGRGNFAGFNLVHLLLLVTLVELAINRLARHEIELPPGAQPPWWELTFHQIGLFSQYFASTLAIGILGLMLWHLVQRQELYRAGLRWALAIVGAGLLMLSIIVMAAQPPGPGMALSFRLETCFVVMVLLLLVAQLTRKGDIGAKIGLLFLAAPLFVHYYGPLTYRLFDGEEALWSDLPEQVRHVGQWSMVLAAMVSPYCFAPRPFMSSAARLAPLMVALLVSTFGVLILRHNYEASMQLASYGLGVYIGPGAPAQFLALYVVALGTITWTLTACLTADSLRRRDIGIGLALIVVSGYGFAWPLQFLVSMVGLMTISQAAAFVVEDERAAASATGSGGFRGPPIADEVWMSYSRQLSRALFNGKGIVVTTARDKDGVAVTHAAGKRGDVEVAMRIERRSGSITMIDVACGRDGEREGEPAWTLYARPERLLGIGAHQEPPATSAPVVKKGDPPFDQRFRVHDAGGLTDTLLDDSQCARATALIDGWVAFWPGLGILYRVCPGQGAPLDHPIPITELAFRGTSAEPSAERMVRIVALLAEMASRGLRDDEPAIPDTNDDDPSVAASPERHMDMSNAATTDVASAPVKSGEDIDEAAASTTGNGPLP